MSEPDFLPPKMDAKWLTDANITILNINDNINGQLMAK